MIWLTLLAWPFGSCAGWCLAKLVHRAQKACEVFAAEDQEQAALEGMGDE